MSGLRRVQIKEFCHVGAGGTPSRAEQSRYFEFGTIPWVKSGELRENLILDTEEHVTEVALQESNLRLVPAGALLVAMYGATVGRLGVLGVTATTNQAVCHIIPDPRIAVTRFLFHYLHHQVPSLIARSVGGAQPNISQGVIKDLAITLPGLEEQRRIADVLDQAEALRAKRRAALGEIETLPQAIFRDLFGDSTTNSKGWPMVPVSSFVSRFEGGRSMESDSNEAAMTRNRVLKISAVTTCYFKPDETKPVPDEYEPPADHFVKPGDLLFSRANTSELVGAVALVAGCASNLLLPDKLWRFVWRDDSKVEPRYIWALFQTPAIRREIARRATGTSGSMKNISQEKLFGIQVPFPAIEAQREFSRRVSAVEKLKAAHRASLSELNALFASLQHRAFQGEL